MPKTIFAQSITFNHTQDLIDLAIANKEGVLAENGALVVKTGKRTGRSPKDRFIVKDATTENTVAWGNVNQPLSTEKFNQLWARATDYLKDKKTYSGHYAVGADPHYQIEVQVTTELAWHLLFCQVLFIRDFNSNNQHPRWTLLNAANFKTDPIRDGVNGDAAVILDFTQHRILVCGTQYAGEMKKGMFSVLNYLLPEQKVLPMHCSANVGEDGDVALFFGLSGTGKTTLSADPNRYLIGDDEHGWGANGVFNFEGGCYAKCINLSEKNEPMIWHAIKNGSVLENVVLDVDGKPNYDDVSLTENTRAAYPLEHIEKRVLENRGGQPKAVIFLTCDLYGVLPPVAHLTHAQAAYYFLSGYTALVGSTEVGAVEGVQPTFSTCFGAPFFPRPAQVYADLLIHHLKETGAPVYLVNTGWTGGAYGEGGKRFSIPTTRAVVTAILDGSIQKNKFTVLPHFNVEIPTSLPDVAPELLDPRTTWKNQDDYKAYANKLITAFQANFKKYQVAEEISAAGPRI
jgi:phosphoenolpyruvate carboxykinase (ATP)